VKVLDFGLARRQGAGGLALDDTATASGARLVGTPLYMAPEQVKGRAVDPRTDVFAFGVLAYELFSGRKPFHGETLTELFIAIDRDEAPKMTGAPPAIVLVIERCLRKAPEARWRDGRELADALARAPLPPAGGRGRARLAVALVASACAIALLAWRGAHRGAEEGAPAPASAAAPVPTKMTDVPLPTGVKPEALLEYRKARQDWRDASLWRGSIEMQNAAKLDPSFAAPHVEVLAWNNGDDQRASYERARQLRASLSARDQAVLDALAPAYGVGTPDFDATARRVAGVAARYPGDAELQLVSATWFLSAKRLEEASAAIERAIAIDPGFGAGYWARGQLALEADPAGFERALDACVAVSPTAGSCVRNKARVHQVAGECAAMEAIAQQLVTIEPDLSAADVYLLNGVIAHGGSRDDTAPILARLVARVPPSNRPGSWPAAIAFQYGAFGEGFHLLGPPTDATWPAHLAILAALEAGDSARAETDAHAYVAKRVVGGANMTSDLAAVTALASLGAMPKGAIADLVERWAPPDVDPYPTALLRAAAATTPAAAGAWSAEVDPKIVARYARSPIRDVTEGATLGHAYLLAGRVDDALPLLRTASGACGMWLDTIFTFAQPRARLDLADALAQKGDTAGACAWLGKIVAQWGDAKPRSVTAEAAKARRRSLACAGP
jgi:serine/threonine-protein kinase